MKRPGKLIWLLLAFLLLASGCKADAAKAALQAPVMETGAPTATQTMKATQAPAATKTAAPPAPEAGDAPFSIVWFSDIQNCSEDYPDVTDRMTEWIVQNIEALNMKYVIVTGDYVNHREATGEWANADRALSKLDGNIPLFAIAGNHDTQDETYETYLSYFGASRFESLPTFGGAYEGGRGRYDLLDVGDVHLLLLGMGYRVDESGIDWLNGILRQYPDRIAILCFHGYLDTDGSYTSDGENLLPGVVEKNPNVRLVLCGHRHGVFHNEVLNDSDGDGAVDHTVYQLLSDYQTEHRGGGGYLSILTFDAARQELRVTAYSPYLDDYNLYADDTGLETFTLPFALLS